MVRKAMDRDNRSRSAGATYARGRAGLQVRTVAMIGLPLAIGGIMLAMARPNGAQNRPAKNVGAAAESSAPATQIDATDDGASRRPLTYYTREVRSTMFSAPQPPPPKPVAVVKRVVKPIKVAPVIVPPVNPYASYAYTGTVKVGDEMMALIENTSTRDGQYVKMGDSFQGGQVSSITDQMVTLTQSGKPYQLAKSDNIVITPLNAPPTTPQPGAAPDPNAQPGGPGGPPWQGGGRGAWRQMMMQQMQNGGTVTLPNGRVLTADQAARRAQFMNRRFNQGGGPGQ